MQIDTWKGSRDEYSREIIAALRLKDYLLANYSGPAPADRINLYIAYYETQSLGSAAHSPRVCIPGDGWEIESLTRQTVRVGNQSIAVNRAIIAKGLLRQIVYYWFEQRGRILAGEYQVKWFLFVDGLTKNRSDGSLVRVITPIEGRDVAAADARLAAFVAAAYPRFAAFVPR
jgi:EpsI family protein